MKHFKHFVLTVLVALVNNLSASAYDFEVNGIYYNILSQQDLICEVTQGDNKYTGEVVIPSSVTYDGKTFKVILIGYRAFEFSYGLTSISIPNSVTAIVDWAFCGCTGLKSIIIPNSVTSIGTAAFNNCRGLTSISIPNSVTSIASYAFSDCYVLTSVTIPNSVTFIDHHVFSDCIGLTSVTIPESVTEIGSFAFLGCTGLTSVTIPESVTEIGPYAFNGCSGLTSINIPDGVIQIREFAFTGCSGLTSINIPNSVTSFGFAAFVNCHSLTSFTIPNSVTSIGPYAFNGCSNLKEIISLNTTPPTINDVIFDGVSKTECILKVPEEAVDDYKAADYWKEFNTIVALGTEYNLTDGEEYANNKAWGCTVNYTRNFTSDAWQALYLPFPMKYEDWADKADVAYINNVHQWDDDNDGVIDRTVLEFITKKSGSIEANKPYVIRPKQTGEVTFTTKNTILYAAPETDGFVDCRSTTTEYTLYGTYQEKTDLYANGYYAMADGGFKKAANASVTLAPFRTYLKIENRTGAGTVQNAKRISIMVDGVVDNDATGIEEITQNSSLETQNCYNLSGQKVGANYKGIAIKNGKKYIIK